MKKRTYVFVACALVFAMLGGCTVQGATAAVDEAISVAGESALAQGAGEDDISTENVDELKDGALRAMLPSERSALADQLQRMARGRGLDLSVELVPMARMEEELLRAHEAGAMPDMYWLAGEEMAQNLLAAGIMPLDLNATDNELPVQALAEFVPGFLRLGAADVVYGMPVGLYAEGTLVNLDVFAAFLDTKDTAALERNLANCSYAEWQIMLETLAAYLARPFKASFTLAGTAYSLSSYRPAAVQGLRGLFAVSTAEYGSVAAVGLGAAYGVGFASPADYLGASQESRSDRMSNPLRALYGQLELETRYLTTAEGLLPRGEGFAAQPLITAAEAQSLFTEGTALFLRSDSRRALQLEEEMPSLAGRLCMVPPKLPLETPSVATINNMLGVAADGYLCVNNGSAAQASGLLVELYTTEEGIELLEQTLHLLPVTDFAPKNLLLRQIGTAIENREAYLLPRTSEELAAIQNRLGEWVFTNLMTKETWEETDEEAFLTAGLGAMALSVQNAEDNTAA